MSEISKQALKVDNSTSFPNNTTGYISPTILRAFNVNMIDSLVDEIGYTADSASWNISIGQLNTYTASFAPSLTQLNAFTASQLTINTGINGFTQSANASINRLDTFSSSFNGYTSSINQIRSNGVTLGTSTIFNLVGPGTFFSASLVQNVQGNIATLTFTSDNAKVNTSSFNDYTASTAATQSVFSASVATSISNLSSSLSAFTSSQTIWNASATASIQELLNLSSSLSGGYATQGELDQSSSVLQANIDTKLNTSSFNAYTQSTAASQSLFSSSVATSFSQSNANISLLSSFTGSYATTGSNTFVGDQYISNGVLQVATYPQTGKTWFAPTAIEAVGTQSVAYEQFVDGGGYDAFNVVTTLDNGTEFRDLPSDTFVLNTWLKIPQNTGNNPKPIMTRGLEITGSTNITGSLIITGSAYGNVISMSVVSNTASMDLSISNFFTLGLTSGQNTRIEPTNILPGETINLLISQPSIGSGSVSYPSTFKFASGLPYSASLNSASVDIMTFITFNTGSIYAASIKNLR
jgi:hypothetical protein